VSDPQKIKIPDEWIAFAEAVAASKTADFYLYGYMLVAFQAQAEKLIDSMDSK